MRRHLDELHRVLLLTLTRGCTLASTVSLEVVAGRMLLNLAVCPRRIRQSIKAKRAIELLGFASDTEAPVADEMERANEHVVPLWQERWDAGKKRYDDLSISSKCELCIHESLVQTRVFDGFHPNWLWQTP